MLYEVITPLRVEEAVSQLGFNLESEERPRLAPTADPSTSRARRDFALLLALILATGKSGCGSPTRIMRAAGTCFTSRRKARKASAIRLYGFRWPKIPNIV